MKVAKLDGQPEIFETLQGEGKNLGKPAVFMRTSLCNLHCEWCDTPYTWRWEGSPWSHDDPEKYYKQSEEILEMQPAEVAAEILKFPTRRVVFTGGEPMIQQAELVKVMSALKEADPSYQFEMETNGTKAPMPDLNELVDQFNVSPKLDNSNNSERLRERPEVYKYYVENPKAYFKFVVAGEEDVPEIKRLVETYQIPAEKIYLMPEGRTEEAVKLHSQQVAEICKDEGYTMTTRLQIAVWGTKRGV